jgi:hypothetical protein
MPVALVDFEAFYDGQTVRIRKGISRVCDGHELHLRFPQNFGSDSWEPIGSRVERSDRVAPRRKAARTGWTAESPPEIRKSWLPKTVRFEAHATAALHAQPFTSEHEIGGGLFGRAEGTTLVVWAVCASAERDGADAMRLNTGLMRQRAKDMRCSWIGTWHTHRHYWPDGPAPSPADRDSWSLCFDDYCRGFNGSAGSFVGMILSPSGGPEAEFAWYPPMRAAWVVKSSRDETIIEPAELKFEYGY